MNKMKAYEDISLIQWFEQDHLGATPACANIGWYYRNATADRAGVEELSTFYAREK